MHVYVHVLVCARVCISAHVSTLYYVYLFRFIRRRVVGSKAKRLSCKVSMTNFNPCIEARHQTL